jgi:hypothetical protein
MILTPDVNVMKLFFSVSVLKKWQKARVFVSDKLFQPGTTLAAKARSLPYTGAPQHILL